MFTNKSITKAGVYSTPNYPARSIYISAEDMYRVKYIVKKAPQEAQWFHRIRKHAYPDKNLVVYEIFDILIPKQYVQAKEVETTPEFWVEFSAELEARYGTDWFDVLAEAQCWCHSHVDMNPSPSSTDDKTFESRIKDAKLSDNPTVPQIMMIHNKKDDYYCRIWDPEFPETIIEGVEIRVGHVTDVSDLDTDMAAKFLKPPPKVTVSSPNHTSGTPGVHKWEDWKQWYDRDSTKVDTTVTATPARTVGFQNVDPPHKIPFGGQEYSVTATDYKNLANALDAIPTTRKKDATQAAALEIYVGGIIDQYLYDSEYGLAQWLLDYGLTSTNTDLGQVLNFDLIPLVAATFSKKDRTTRIQLITALEELGGGAFELSTAINAIGAMRLEKKAINAGHVSILSHVLTDCDVAISKWCHSKNYEIDATSFGKPAADAASGEKDDSVTITS